MTGWGEVIAGFDVYLCISRVIIYFPTDLTLNSISVFSIKLYQI